MRKDRRLGLSGLMCLFVTGCFSNGPYGYQGAYAPPHTAMVSQPYTMVQTPSGAAWVPATPASPSSLSAPEPARKAAPTSFGDDDDLDSAKKVPTPTDLKKTPVPVVDPMGFDEDASIERRGVRTSQRTRPRPLDEEEFDNELDRAEPEMSLADDESDPAASNVRSANFNTQVRANSVLPASAVKEQFGYDAEGYSWLKGVIEFNPKLQVWHLTYSQTPADNDQYGGEVTLKNTAHFKHLRSGEIVRVEGQFDPQQADRLGKPVYEVVRMIRDVKR